MNASNSHTSQQRRRDVVVAAACGVLVAGMVGMAFAAVPLYNWFCRATGLGGTPQVATAAPGNEPLKSPRITVGEKRLRSLAASAALASGSLTTSNARARCGRRRKNPRSSSPLTRR